MGFAEVMITRAFCISKQIYLDQIQGSELGIQLRLSSQHLQSKVKKEKKKKAWGQKKKEKRKRKRHL